MILIREERNSVEICNSDGRSGAGWEIMYSSVGKSYRKQDGSWWMRRRRKGVKGVGEGGGVGSGGGGRDEDRERMEYTGPYLVSFFALQLI